MRAGPLFRFFGGYRELLLNTYTAPINDSEDDLSLWWANLPTCTFCWTAAQLKKVLFYT